MTARRLPWLALGAVVLVAVVVLAVRSRPSDATDARAARLERELKCPVCEGQSVADSNSPEARAMRGQIPAKIRAGETDEQIRADFARVYGDLELTPERAGIGLVAWIVPVGAVLCGLGGIGVALRRWRRTPRLSATAEDEVIVARERAR